MTIIHWLRITDHKQEVERSFSARLAEHLGSSKPQTPFFGYTLAHRFDCGASMHLSPNREDMGRLWDFNGETCETLGMETMSVILRWASEYSCTSSRIDLAHDFFGQELTVNEVAQDWYKGIETGGARKRKESWTDGAVRNEFNLGARSSDIYLRCYDKGMEMNLDEFKKGDWTRLEFELKGKMSSAVLLERSVMRDTNIGDFCASVWLGLAHGFLAAETLQKTPFLWGIMPTYIQLPKRANATEYWLENQVKNGIINYALDKPNGEQWLADYLTFVIDSYKHKKANSK